VRTVIGLILLQKRTPGHAERGYAEGVGKTQLESRFASFLVINETSISLDNNIQRH
jgi:hypothetical protein